MLFKNSPPLITVGRKMFKNTLGEEHHDPIIIPPASVSLSPNEPFEKKKKFELK
jgi:hypothetical protein